MRKIVETFFFMRKVEAIDYVDDPNISIKDLKSTKLERIEIYNKQLLYDYLTEDFASTFFTKGKIALEAMEIVGPVRLRTVHT